MDSFAAFTPLHAVSLVVSGLAIAAVVLLGLAARRRGRAATSTRWIAVLGLVNWVVQTVYYAAVEWHPAGSLPLHFCDIAALLGPIALLTDRRLLRGILYFWAFAFTTQALITPTLTDGPASPAFWLFWCNHAGVIGMATYDVAVRGYRPTRLDLLQIIAVSYAYAALVLPLNVVMGWNYGFVGPTQPSTPTVIEWLGPWPERVALVLFMGTMMLVHVYLPWPLARWLLTRRQASVTEVRV